MSLLREKLLGLKSLPEPGLETSPTLKVSARDIAGYWLCEQNLNASTEAYQMLVLEEEGKWKEFENGLLEKSPAHIRETGEWWVREGILNRLSEEHERHKDRGRQLEARVIQFTPTSLWLHGIFKPGQEKTVRKYEKSSAEEFLARTQHIQDEARQIRKIAVALYLTIGLSIGALCAYALLQP
jgi:hypothetical protein